LRWKAQNDTATAGGIVAIVWGDFVEALRQPWLYYVALRLAGCGH